VYTARKRSLVDSRVHHHGWTRPVYTAVYTTVHGCLRAVYIVVTRRCARPSRHCPYTAVNTVVYTYTRPVYETYRICNFLTIKTRDCIRKQSKASYCWSPEVYSICSKKWNWDKDSLFRPTDGAYKVSHHIHRDRPRTRREKQELIRR